MSGGRDAQGEESRRFPGGSAFIRKLCAGSINDKLGSLTITARAAFRDVERGAYDMAKSKLETDMKNMSVCQSRCPVSQHALI
jgi:hypothetical protein